MELQLPTPFHPTTFYPQDPHNRVEKTKAGTTLDDKQGSQTTSKEKDARHVIPPAPAQTIESHNYAKEAIKHSLEAATKANLIQNKLANKEIGSSVLEDIPSNLSIEQTEKLIKEYAKKLSNASRIKPDAQNLLDEASEAQKSLEKSSNAFQSKTFATPESLALQSTHKSLMQQSNSFLAIVDYSLKAARNDEALIKVHNEEAARINTNVENLLSLQQLLQKYTTLNLEKVDLTKDGTTEDEKRDFQRIAELIRGAAQPNGVLWKQLGWNSAKERESYLKGVMEAAATLQTKNKINDLKLQQAYQNFAARLILATTLMKRHHDLIVSIIHNMKNG